MQNTTIFALQTNDIDEMATTLGGPNLVATQLSSGIFIGKLLRVQLDAIQCWQIDLSQKVQLLGNLPPGTVSFWIPLTTNCSGVWQGAKCHAQEAILDVNGKIDYTHLEGKVVACLAPTREKLLQQISAAPLDPVWNIPLNRSMLIPNSIQLRLLQNQLEEIFALAVSNPELLLHTYLNQIMIKNLLFSITELLLSSNSLPEKAGRSLTRITKLKQAVEFIQKNLHQRLTLQSIAAEVGIGTRSLIYSFKESFGMGPMEYCKNTRLSAVRRHLKLADSNADTVIEIAKKWGFHHMGHFSTDYKVMFGELPSQTLKYTPHSQKVSVQGEIMH
jgi:AraC family ethanolamine operon transcriptional activator